MTIQKLPAPGEYWRSRSGEIRLIAGDVRQHDSGWSGPYPIISINRSGDIATHDASGREYNDTDESPNDLTGHLSECTGFDWKPPAPIDPGEGWELLPKRVLLIAGDQVLQTTGDWIDTHFVGDEANDACTYRRRKPPTETWPKYFVPTFNSEHYYRCDSENEVWAVNERTEEFQGKTATFMASSDTWREVTESEALARVKPAEPIAHAVERTATPLVTAVVESPDDWVEITDPEHRLRNHVDYYYGWSNEWEMVKGYHGTKMIHAGQGKARCRRRDLPEPNPVCVTACETCGIGYHLPSGKCDHCNSERKEQPAQQPKRTPVDLIAIRDNRVIWRPHGQTLMKNEQFIQNDADGFYVCEYCRSQGHVERSRE